MRNRQNFQQSVPERGLGMGAPYPVPRQSKEMMVAVEKMEDECGRLPDLYMRKFRILEKLIKERPAYPLATHVKQGTNKPVFFQHTQWDKVLKEVYWRATDFQEEKKIKLAQAFQLSKKMKNTMGKKFRIRDELNFYHKLLCFQFSKELEDFFEKTHEQLNEQSAIVAQDFVPPHEKREIQNIEDEEKDRKEKEEAQKKTDLEIEKQSDQIVDTFFGSDNPQENYVPQLNGEENPIKDVSTAQDDNHLNQELDKEKESLAIKEDNPKIQKKLKPIAAFVYKMKELNPESFDTQQMSVMSEFRDFYRKKDIIDKLRVNLILII